MSYESSEPVYPLYYTEGVGRWVCSCVSVYSSLITIHALGISTKTSQAHCMPAPEPRTNRLLHHTLEAGGSINRGTKKVFMKGLFEAFTLASEAE